MLVFHTKSRLYFAENNISLMEGIRLRHLVLISRSSRLGYAIDSALTGGGLVNKMHEPSFHQRSNITQHCSKNAI